MSELEERYTNVYDGKSGKFVPMKGVDLDDVDLDNITYPVMASAKIDGVRAVKLDGRVNTSSMKAMPSKHVQKVLDDLPDGLDGELIVGEPTDPKVFRNTTTEVMAFDKVFDFKFYVFDWYSHEGFKDRILKVFKWHDKVKHPSVVPVKHDIVGSKEELLKLEEEYLLAGYEGIIVRSLPGKYKFGRATFNEGYLFKRKPKKDSEAVILELQPLYTNTNAKVTNELGRSSRSLAKEGLVASDMMGNLLVQDIHNGAVFGIGTGFTKAERIRYWEQADDLIGKIVRYKYFGIGNYDLPRHPVFEGFRNVLDITSDNDLLDRVVCPHSGKDNDSLEVSEEFVKSYDVPELEVGQEISKQRELGIIKAEEYILEREHDIGTSL